MKKQRQTSPHSKKLNSTLVIASVSTLSIALAGMTMTIAKENGPLVITHQSVLGDSTESNNNNYQQNKKQYQTQSPENQQNQNYQDQNQNQQVPPPQIKIQQKQDQTQPNPSQPNPSPKIPQPDNQPNPSTDQNTYRRLPPPNLAGNPNPPVSTPSGITRPPFEVINRNDQTNTPPISNPTTGQGTSSPTGDNNLPHPLPAAIQQLLYSQTGTSNPTQPSQPKFPRTGTQRTATGSPELGFQPFLPNDQTSTGTPRFIRSDHSFLQAIADYLKTQGIDLASDSGQLKIGRGGIDAQTDLPLTLDATSGAILAQTPDGSTRPVHIFPDQVVHSLLQSGMVSTIASESASPTASGSSGIHLEMHNGDLAYRVEGTKNLKLFGLFPYTTQATTYVSPADGQVTPATSTIWQNILKFFSK